MMIVDKPYVSGLLKDTLLKNRFPVLKTPDAVGLLPHTGIHFLEESVAIEKIKSGQIKTIYTSSENSIGWIHQNLGFTGLPDKVEFFKNKIKFRQALSDLYPGFFFRAINLKDLDGLKTQDLPFPFIIKPGVGFFSLGVHRVNAPAEWQAIKQKIQQETEVIRNTYPREVLDISTFIIEEIIEGEEFTIDVFYNNSGNPVVLGMMHHIFAGHDDTSDRLYTTSPQIFRDNLEPFTEFLQALGERLDLRNFPLHIEVRVDTTGKIVPIEGNPLRYGGWCTSAELTHYAFGVNPYECVMNETLPNWDEILEAHSGNNFSIIILNNNSGIDAKNISSFNYQKLTSRLGKVIELRKTDVVRFHIFGFVFAETPPEKFSELEALLNSNLREFIEVSAD
jgi:hypothetical protein